MDEHPSLKLKRVERNEEPELTRASYEAFDIEKLDKSLKQKPWILHDQIINTAKLDCEHLDNKVILLPFPVFPK